MISIDLKNWKLSRSKIHVKIPKLRNTELIRQAWKSKQIVTRLERLTMRICLLQLALVMLDTFYIFMKTTESTEEYL